MGAIRPMLPNKPRRVPRVNDRRVLNGIFWMLRSGAPWRGMPDSFGQYTTCYDRFARWPLPSPSSSTSTISRRSTVRYTELSPKRFKDFWRE